MGTFNSKSSTCIVMLFYHCISTSSQWSEFVSGALLVAPPSVQSDFQEFFWICTYLFAIQEHTYISIRVSVSLLLMWKSVKFLQILYTGDFSRQEDRHLMAAEIPSVRPDILITVSVQCIINLFWFYFYFFIIIYYDLTETNHKYL